MRITGIYAALAAIIVLFLAVRVALGRRSAAVGYGDGGHTYLAKRIRAHANATETLPLALLLLLILELNQTQPLFLHVFGCVLILARIFSAIGLTTSSGNTPWRAIGFGLTFLIVAIMAVLLLWQWVIAKTLF